MEKRGSLPAGKSSEAVGRRWEAEILETLDGQIRGRLEEAARLAATLGVPLFLVGGGVRDLLLGRPAPDLDLTLEGDGVAFAERLGRRLGAQVRSHPAFGTATLRFADGLPLDVATARRERYPRPGRLPEVEPGSLRDDLFRRDFTVNALALRLHPGSALIDPFAGREDLERRLLRVLHERSFLEDPTRILRGARLEVRLGFRLESGSETLARRAAEGGAFEPVSGERLRRELLFILERREGAIAALERLGDLGVLRALEPEMLLGAEQRETLRRVEEARGRLEGAAGEALRLRERDLWLAALALDLPEEAARGWARRLRLSARHRDLVEGLGSRLEEARRVLRRRDLPPHRAAAALAPLSQEELVLLAAWAGAGAERWVERELTAHRRLRLAIRGADLIRHGAAAGPGIGAALARTREARLDGRIGREQELEFALRILGRGPARGGARA